MVQGNARTFVYVRQIFINGEKTFVFMLAWVSILGIRGISERVCTRLRARYCGTLTSENIEDKRDVAHGKYTMCRCLCVLIHGGIII